MLDFFRYYELNRVSPYTEDSLSSILDEDDKVRLVDTEFSGQSLVQISIRDARGNF